MTAKRVIGIIMIVFGSFFLFMSLIFTVSFLGIGGIMDEVSDQTEDRLEDFVDSGAVVCTGEVISTDSGTLVEYYVEEEDATYNATVSATNSAYPVGSSVSVYYDPYNPTKCMVPDLTEDTMEVLGGTFSIIGGIVGVAFAILGIPLLIAGIILVRKSKAQITG